MVTARHVAKKIEGKEFLMRTNTVDGKVEIIHGHADTRWWYHPTEEEHVDAAVTIFPYGQLSHLDIQPVGLELFLDNEKIEKHNIGTGDEIFIAGLFTEVTETSKNIPIVRIGNVAMMPGEKIPYKDGKLIEAYLVEARSTGGLSGSPVFVRETLHLPVMDEVGSPKWEPGKRLFGPGRILFFGSVIGHWETGFPLSMAEAVNMGVAPVVPARKIHEILMQPRLVEIMSKKSPSQPPP
jgi:hypothetical protein